MKLICTICLSLWLLSFSACGQNNVETLQNKQQTNKTDTTASNQDQLKVIKAQAEEMYSAFFKPDYGKFVDCIHPKVVEMTNGKENTISGIEGAMFDMKSKNVEIKNIEVTEPKEIITTGSQLFAIVPQTTKLKTPQGTVISESFIIAVSENNGKEWKFVTVGAGGNIGKEQLTALFPSAEKLQLPERKSAKLVSE